MMKQGNLDKDAIDIVLEMVSPEHSGFVKLADLLETGNNQPEAIALYHKNGYTQIEPFGRYVGNSNSVCFEKKLKR